MNKNLKQKILSLRSNGKTYTEIAEILDCSKGTISYYCGEGQVFKTQTRRRASRAKCHPFKIKIESFFLYRNNDRLQKKQVCNWKSLLKDKVSRFCATKLPGNNKMYNKATFTVEDVITKFGENPKCYLTGKPINIYEPRTYEFDHKMPLSRGGESSLDNLGICTKQANRAKADMTPEEFIELCKQVIKYNQ